MPEPRRFREPRLVIATHNKGKLAEIADLVRPFGVEVVSAGALGLPEPEETGTTFEANAILKARAAAESSRLPALADDSGLVVPALGGEPGIYSARWAGPKRDFSLAMRTVEDRLGGKSDRRAHFVAALALAWPDRHVEVFRGEAHGVLVWPPRGSKGFGYDPMFQPEGDTRTFGEIEPEEKHRISHRADAFRKLVAACFARPSTHVPSARGSG
ncbi:MAG TPA: RdgB/HAM1 family non-canonical purine NTP pyrophosphatase [Stellaceae bacterium]|nr:RdgB/HAM1 family non-canonical purine NTP pyrophosphatase [Stellaceae bacterium]